MNEDGHMLAAAKKCNSMTSFRKYKAYADIRGVPFGGAVKVEWGCR